VIQCCTTLKSFTTADGRRRPSATAALWCNGTGADQQSVPFRRCSRALLSPSSPSGLLRCTHRPRRLCCARRGGRTCGAGRPARERRDSRQRVEEAVGKQRRASSLAVNQLGQQCLRCVSVTQLTSSSAHAIHPLHRHDYGSAAAAGADLDVGVRLLAPVPLLLTKAAKGRVLGHGKTIAHVTACLPTCLSGSLAGLANLPALLAFCWANASNASKRASKLPESKQARQQAGTPASRHNW
jgi:hypothetical protein